MTAVFYIGQTLPPSEIGFASATDLQPYLLASGDDNPLHSDPDFARVAGFDAIVVPGMLVMGKIAAALADWVGQGAVQELTARFVDPLMLGVFVPLGGRVVALRPDGAAVLRITLGPPRRPLVLAEAVIAQPQSDG